MRNQNQPDDIRPPDLVVTMMMGSVWLTLIAFAAAASATSASSLGEVLTILFIAIGAAAMGAVFLICGIEIYRAEREREEGDARIRAALRARWSRQPSEADSGPQRT